MAVSNTLMVLHWVFRNQMAQLTQSPGKVPLRIFITAWAAGSKDSHELPAKAG